ncbi:hypothetical protein PR003_g29252 [Phytophthora rubi]|uniref:Reverse transcriptase Ty1/copia-type domain-containing protein n=2 Tax=Phytophthora rubi TaxID=129364 RepID=A0A6A4BT68_9STRA|nr:hypothetical protein PR003_g29252 [Phytophthora rubi]
MLLMLCGAPVVWRSTFQKTVALSSTEAEYMALSDCVKECIWMRRLLKDIGAEQVGATVIYEDNQGAMALAKNVGYQARTKHIDIRYHFIREKVVSNEVELEYMDTKNQLADFMTKGLSSKTLRYLMMRSNATSALTRWLGNEAASGYLLTEIFLASPEAVKDVNSKRSAHVVIEDGVLVTQGKRAELQIDASGSSAVYVSAPDTAVSVQQLILEATESAKIEYSVESIDPRSELQMGAQGSSRIAVLSSTVKTSQLELDALNSGEICIDAQEVKATWRDIQGKRKVSMPNAVKKHGTTGCVASKLPARKAAQITASPTSATGYVDNNDLDDDLDNDLNDSTED